MLWDREVVALMVIIFVSALFPKNQKIKGFSLNYGEFFMQCIMRSGNQMTTKEIVTEIKLQ